MGLGGETALSWYQRTSAPALNWWRPRVYSTESMNSQTAVWYCEKVLAAGPSCWKPVMVNKGRASLNAALVGMPGMPRAADAVVPRVGPACRFERRV